MADMTAAGYIERAYFHTMDADPEGQRRARLQYDRALEDLCDPDELDLEAIYMTMGEVLERCPHALVAFAAQAVLELVELGWAFPEDRDDPPQLTRAEQEKLRRLRETFGAED